jgi:Lon protease-like protein
MSDLLPLFPLDLVLFPGTPLPLHIFEPRYKEMIGECLERRVPFGIVRAKENEMASIGCSAEIIEVTKKYADGRMDILAEGRQRFEVLNLDEERSFLRADVLYFDDEPGEASGEDNARMLQLHGELMKLAGSSEAPPEGVPQLSFQITGGLPLDPDFKQALLAMRSEPERVGAIIRYYEALVPRVKLSMKAREKAGGNGHVH